jgi:hypothetical protein
MSRGKGFCAVVRRESESETNSGVSGIRTPRGALRHVPSSTEERSFSSYFKCRGFMSSCMY